MMISGNFAVNGAPFALWFEQWRKARIGDFANPLHAQNFEGVMKGLKQLMCKSSISLAEFAGIFCVVYNETGGRFLSMKEWGGAGHYQAHGYTTKSAGRGYIQLTSDSVYRVTLQKLGYDYDALSSEQLDALFLRQDIALRSVCIYLSHDLLAGKHWRLVQAGKFYEFGVAISGGSTAYGALYDRRCKALLADLQRAKLQNLSPTRRLITWGVYLLIAVAIAFVGYLLYRTRLPASPPAPAPSEPNPLTNVRPETLPSVPPSPPVGSVQPVVPATP